MTSDQQGPSTLRSGLKLRMFEQVNKRDSRNQTATERPRYNYVLSETNHRGTVSTVYFQLLCCSSTLSHAISRVVIARERSNLNRSKASDCRVGLRPPRNDTQYLSCDRPLVPADKLNRRAPRIGRKPSDYGLAGRISKITGEKPKLQEPTLNNLR